MSQAEFAQQLGLTRAAVSAWVTGRARPRAALMAGTAGILQSDVATLFARDADAGSARPVSWYHRPAHPDGGREYGSAAVIPVDAPSRRSSERSRRIPSTSAWTAADPYECASPCTRSPVST
ncbi:helix-turn-helix domain-containing protein [Streptomyces alkaliterrae]|uniref:helix-turn-helix domain-containing protein n=1 Tax=Streptomyces alkaliterrae TaxID=2213162 RepID=UPI001E39C499|nr:helix-turn-helix transcriptional regulator [Streptomyces alkaliterrae]